MVRGDGVALFSTERFQRPAPPPCMPIGPMPTFSIRPALVMQASHNMLCLAVNSSCRGSKSATVAILDQRVWRRSRRSDFQLGLSSL